MRRKLAICVTIFSVVVIFLAMTDTNTTPETQETTIETEDTYHPDYDSDSSYSNDSSETSYDSDSSYDYSSSSNTIEHYCEVDGCTEDGTKSITGLDGEPEYYCLTHYQEMQDIISDMEEDVGTGTASTHQCEECSKEGTHELIGLSGGTEYYCTEHYNEMVEIIEMMLEDYDE